MASLRTAGSTVAELAAQALAAGAPGPPLRRILAGMEPLPEQERPHVSGIEAPTSICHPQIRVKISAAPGIDSAPSALSGAAL
ncbi:hypothetical protein [Streptomyces sp. NPDC092903]|uniref:hypothetical protein n=1 Tax=Streptomyces sp. NPDC092903 TaxID=3366017 RepID=UPI0037F10F9D